MAIGISNTSNTGWLTSTDVYDAKRYYAEQEHRYLQEMERQRNAAMQNAYNPYMQSQQGVTDLQREQQAQKPKAPAYLDNKKLLLLGEAS